MKQIIVLLGLLLLLAGVAPGGAAPLTLDGPSLTFFGAETIGGYEYAASASFALTSDNTDNILTLVLTNTAGQAAGDPAKTLSAVFWDSATVLSPVAAALSSGSAWVNPKNVPLNIGGNYCYDGDLRLTGVNPAPANQGVSSVGIGLFGDGNFGGVPVPANGDAYNILPASGIAGNGNNFNKKYPMANNSMTFTFHTRAASLDVDNVSFHYSSAYDTGVHLTTIPLPPTVVLLGSGLLGLALLRPRSKRQA